MPPSSWSCLHWDLPEGRAFLNHGSFGLAPRELRHWRYRLLDQIERDPVAFLVDQCPELLKHARQCLARLLGASAEQLAFVPSTTYGLNQLFQRLQLPPGSEVLAYDHAYNATLNLVRYAAEQRGWTLRLIPLALPLTSSAVLVDQLQRHWRSSTRLLLLDHITSCSALVFPVAELAAFARASGALVVVDGAHAPGSIPLQLEQLGVDAYVGNLHKWLCCPRGSAFLWLQAPWQDQLRPLVISHGANASLTPGQSRFHAEHDWIGTADPTPWLALPEMVRLFGPDHPSLMQHNHQLAQEGQQWLLQALNQEQPIASAAFQAGMAALPLLPVGQLDGTRLQRLLLDEGFQLPVIPRTPHTPAVPQYLRISCFAYNDIEQLRRLATCLPPLIQQATNA